MSRLLQARQARPYTSMKRVKTRCWYIGNNSNHRRRAPALITFHTEIRRQQLDRQGTHLVEGRYF